jgi:hypothetical protein
MSLDQEDIQLKQRETIKKGNGNNIKLRHILLYSYISKLGIFAYPPEKVY